ncbi:MAG: hypothetical protein AB7T06_36630 [Kofleriaceae bacterium]
MIALQAAASATQTAMVIVRGGRIASHHTMRFLTKVAIVGGLIYVGTRVVRSLSRRPSDESVDADSIPDAEVVIIGVAEVDPLPYQP